MTAPRHGMEEAPGMTTPSQMADAMSGAFLEWLKKKDLIARGLLEAEARLLAEAFMAGVFAGVTGVKSKVPVEAGDGQVREQAGDGMGAS
jgi:hypothetical protein